MKSRLKYMWLQFLTLLFFVSVAYAQPAQLAQENFSQPELEQMLAPIALYPDALLSQMLMASTYPTEVVEASYWLKANHGLRGSAAVEASQNQQWDISVKSLLPFPQLLGTMETKLDWTENLGNAFLAQEQQVMDTIQMLRQKAMAAGYLKSDNRVRVAQQDRLISIDLVQPTAVYVPYYNPTVVYGTWRSPDYAPVYWDQWPGYAVTPGHSGMAWSPMATVVTVGILYAAVNWRSHSVHYSPRVSYWSRHQNYSHYRRSGASNSQWKHDATHRRDIPYRTATVNKRFGKAASTHNAKVGPRPTVSDIRTGKHKIVPVSTSAKTTPVSRRTSGVKRVEKTPKVAPRKSSKTSSRATTKVRPKAAPRKNLKATSRAAPRKATPKATPRETSKVMSRANARKTPHASRNVAHHEASKSVSHAASKTTPHANHKSSPKKHDD